MVPKKGQKRMFKAKSRGSRPGVGKMNRYDARTLHSSFGGEISFTGSESRAFLIASVCSKSMTGGTGVSGESIHFLLARLSP